MRKGEKMGDLISRQAAIEYCYALINAENPSDPRDEWNYSQERINQTEVILHHLEFMPSAQAEPQWISCSERLPDVAQRVLLSGHGQVMVGMLHSFGKYSLEPTGISYVYPKDDIEAWMPLPEPWKGEHDGNQS